MILFLCFMYGLVPPGLLGRTVLPAVLVHWMDPARLKKNEINKFNSIWKRGDDYHFIHLTAVRSYLKLYISPEHCELNNKASSDIVVDRTTIKYLMKVKLNKITKSTHLIYSIIQDRRILKTLHKHEVAGSYQSGSCLLLCFYIGVLLSMLWILKRRVNEQWTVLLNIR